MVNYIIVFYPYQHLPGFSGTIWQTIGTSCTRLIYHEVTHDRYQHEINTRADNHFPLAACLVKHRRYMVLCFP